MKQVLLVMLTLCAWQLSYEAWAEKPCDDYPKSKQARCKALWKQINADAVAEMAEFGFAQLRRRQEGKISQEQHLRENFAFIQASAEKRLKLLAERMATEEASENK